MRVLHVSPAYHPATVYGGPIRSLYGLTRALARAGIEVRVLTTNANGRSEIVHTYPAIAQELELNLNARYTRRLALESVSPGLVAELWPSTRWADVVHLTGVYSFPTLPTLVAVRALGRPLVWSPRGSLQRWAETRRRAAKRAWELACRALVTDRTVLHTTSEDEARQSTGRMRGLRSVVIPNGVDQPERVWHEPSDDFRVLFLGRLDPIKGIENLLEACAKLGSDVKLTLAGAGKPDYEARLRALSRSLGLDARARFVGEVTDADKAALFARADVLVLPSFSENFGLVVAEALAHGVPAVAARGTPWRALEDQAIGKWVDNAPGSLARALSELRVTDLAVMGERGRAWVRAELGWDAAAERTIAVYRELVSAAAR